MERHVPSVCRYVAAGPLDVWKLRAKPRASFRLVGSMIASAQMSCRAGVRAEGSIRQVVLESSKRARYVAIPVYQAGESRCQSCSHHRDHMPGA